MQQVISFCSYYSKIKQIFKREVKILPNAYIKAYEIVINYLAKYLFHVLCW